MKVIVQPQNGYINRIQALASSALLARELGAEFEVQWIPSPAAPASPDSIFSPQFLECFAPNPSTWELEPYLNFDSANGVVSLAGLDKGEQVFMPELKSLLESGCVVSEIRISAGGKFSLGGEDVGFSISRSNFYRNELEFTKVIEDAVADAIADHGDYLGLHLRYSDRNHEAPTRRKVLEAVKSLARSSGISSMYVASDSPTALKWWTGKLRNLGLEPWWLNSVDQDRSDPNSAISALVDWKLLASSKAMIYFSQSSFGEEAAVASNGGVKSIALETSRARRTFAIFGNYVRAALSYPRRHWL